MEIYYLAPVKSKQKTYRRKPKKPKTLRLAAARALPAGRSA